VFPYMPFNSFPQYLDRRMNTYDSAYVPAIAHIQDLERDAAAARLAALDRRRRHASTRTGLTDTPKGTPMGLFRHWMARFRSIIRAATIAIDPGEDADDLAPESAPGRPSRVMLTHDDFLWFKTSEDTEGRITLGLLECSPRSIGVLVDDNGESLGLRLSRAEAQDLHRSLVAWLAHSARTMTS
jgi:hypothetical protein